MKRFTPAKPDASLVDFGCNVEAFTDGAILELETLGEEVELVPGAAALHREEWHLLPAISLPDDDVAAERALEPLLARTIRTLD